MNTALKLTLIALCVAVASGASIFESVQFSPNDDLNTRILNGQHALPNQLPWHVTINAVLRNGDRQLCGGALISSNNVLTSAQCVHNPNFDYFVLHFGSTNLTRPLITVEVNPATPNARLIHPQFNPTTNINNLALLRLPLPLPINTPAISTIRLPANNQQNTPFAESIGTFSGHGRVANAGNASRALRFVRLRVIPLAQCSQVYGAAIANNNILCTVGEEFEQQGPCEMDFGGPLVLQEPNGQTLIGIHSFVSNNGCVFGQPAGFTRIGGFLAWVQQNGGVAPRSV